MMNLKNSQHGFTLIETLLSITLVALSVGPIVDLQTIAGRSISQTIQELDRTITAYDFFVSHVGGEQAQAQKTSTDPEMTLLFEQKPIPADSVLAKQFEHMRIEQVSWQWQDDRGQQHGLLAGLHFVPPQPEDVVATKDEAKKEDATEKKSADTEQPKKDVPSATEKSIQISSIKNAPPIIAAPGGKR